MRRNDLPQPPTQTHHRVASRVVLGVVVPVVAAFVLTGCVGAGGTPTAIDSTITPTAAPTSAASTPVEPPAGSTSTPPPPAQGASGVEGTTVTTRCPVVTDEGCPKTPMMTHVVVTSAAVTVAAVDTGADGRFRIALRPGVYTIKATPRPMGVTRPATITVTVVAGRFASLTLELDSAIQ